MLASTTFWQQKKYFKLHRHRTKATLQTTQYIKVKQPVPESELCFLLWCSIQSSKPPSWWTPSDCWGDGVSMVVLNSSRLPIRTCIQTDRQSKFNKIPSKRINDDIKWGIQCLQSVTKLLPEFGRHLLLQCCPLHVKLEKQPYSHCACKNKAIMMLFKCRSPALIQEYWVPVPVLRGWQLSGRGPDKSI